MEKIINFGAKKTKPTYKKYKKTELANMVISLQEDINEKNNELIELYKEREDGITAQKHYLDVVEEQKQEIAKLKDNIKELKTEMKEYKGNIGESITSLLEIAPSVENCNNPQDFFRYLEIYYISEDSLNVEDMQSSCNKLGITKESIKNYNEDLYNRLKIKEWEIGD